MLKVAAYCRVSTDSSDQANSLASQENYFREYIERNPEWELAQVFVDTGITGTSTKKRAAFQQMMKEALSGEFHLILTKEISRFARNTLDSIYYTRKLREHGVGVIFMNDNINTLDHDAELRLTIMSSIAQEESRKTSDRVKWGQRRSMEQGVVFGRDMLGYDVRGGKLFVNQEGAEVVRLIFHKFVNEGKGAHVIARELKEANIPTSTYMKQWSNTVILRIIKNEKYAGDLIQKKTITPNYLNHEKKYNKGEEEFVVLYEHHEPIISRELFDKAQREVERRSKSVEQKKKHSNRYCFSGKIKCGICGSAFVSRTKKRKNGSVYRAWRCYEAAQHGAFHFDKDGNGMGCNGTTVNDDDLKSMMQKIMKSLLLDRTVLIAAVVDEVAKALQEGEQTKSDVFIESKMQALADKKQGLIELYLTQNITKTEFQNMKGKYDTEITQLKQRKESQMETAVLSKNRQSNINEIKQFLLQILSGETWDDMFYHKILDNITVEKDGVITVGLQHLIYKWYIVTTF